MSALSTSNQSNIMSSNNDNKNNDYGVVSETSASQTGSGNTGPVLEASRPELGKQNGSLGQQPPPMIAGHHNPQFNANNISIVRNGSPVGRPPSSASTCSTASYHTASTIHTSHHHYNNPNAPQGNGMMYNSNNPTGGGPRGPNQNTYNHPQNGLIRPSGRYPLPPRNGGPGMGHHQPQNSYYQQQQHHLPGLVPPRMPGPPRYQHQYPQQHHPQYQNYDYQQQQFQHHHGNDPSFHRGLYTGGHAGTPPGYPNSQAGGDAMEHHHQEGPTTSNNGPDQQEMQPTHHLQEQQQESGGPSPSCPPYHPKNLGQVQGMMRAQHEQHEHALPNDHYGGEYRHQNQQHHQYSEPSGGRKPNMHHGGHYNNYAAGPPPLQYRNVSGHHQGQGPTGGGGPMGMRPLHAPYYPQQQYNDQYYSHLPPPPQGGFQLPPYAARRGSLESSPETTEDVQAISRSPSPPPQPPSFAADQQQQQEVNRQNSETKPFSNQGPSERTVSLNSMNAKKENEGTTKPPAALGDRGNMSNSLQGASATSSVSGKAAPSKPQEEDAASILLQLSAVVKKEDDAENENPQQDDKKANSMDEDNKTSSLDNLSSVPNTVQGSASMDDASEGTTNEHHDSAPELTSEPSSDSTEHHAPDTEFPCPVPERYPTRLSLPFDNAKLNSLHCFLRSELLEIFVVQKSRGKKSPTHSPGSSVGRVGLRCVHCALVKRQKENRDEAPMAVFYPKSIAEIYRLVTSWQRCHLRKCRNLPPGVRSKWQSLRDTDKSRGKTHYWVTSAKQIGLLDCQSRAGGIRFDPTFDTSALPAETMLVPSASTDSMDTEVEDTVGADSTNNDTQTEVRSPKEEKQADTTPVQEDPVREEKEENQVDTAMEEKAPSASIANTGAISQQATVEVL